MPVNNYPATSDPLVRIPCMGKRPHGIPLKASETLRTARMGFATGNIGALGRAIVSGLQGGGSDPFSRTIC
jgi:hypothetical protein